ncbi:MAG: TonB-dependent receptor [Bacteroidales bacterium]|jgi:hemoglobin/transferrin/lactoferrin receptor protein|nr:TonB-dependent receptor [Bacteroidales bacterium]MDY0201930.1 TonB-dependent receptor [Tenuifilaceae bacterium]
MQNIFNHLQAGITVFIFLVIFTNPANAAAISGTVVDSGTKESLPGVSVFVKNTVIGTSTDINGNFCLNKIPDHATTLVFSFVGFATHEVNILNNAPDSLNVELYPSTIALQEVVISTAKNQLKSFEQTTPVSLLTQSKISENATQDIADIISREPAISLAGEGFHRAASIRGLARKRIVVMVDGSRISSERNVGPPGTFVNPLDVKNIEILRGPYSTLYGSDAVGGVINIITQDYQQPLSNNYVGGTFNSNYQSIRKGYNANLMLSSKLNDKVFFHLTAGTRKAESYKDAHGNEVMGTNFSEKSLTAKVNWQINKNHKLGLNGMLSKADSIGKPAYSDSLNALHPNDDHYKIGLNYQWTNIAGWLPKMNIKASAHKHDITARIYNYQNAQYGRVMNVNKNLYNTDYVYQHDFSFIINPKLKVLAGLDFYQRDDIHIDELKRAFIYEANNPGFHIGELAYTGPQDTTIDNSYQRSMGVFAQANYSLSEKLALNGGLRWNTFYTHANLISTTNVGPPYDYSQNVHETKTKSDDAFSGNFGLLYMPVKQVHITGNIGQAFRVPSTKELFVNTMTLGGMNYCNPDLVPEQSFNLDFGIKLNDKKQNSLELAIFRNKINNMIILEWDSLHATGQFNNKNALVYGGEITFDYKILKQLSLRGNLSYVKGEDENDEALMDIPPLQINLETRYFIKPEKLFVALAGKYNAKQSKVAVGDVPTDAFVVLDILAAWKMNKYLKATFSVANVFNNDYREHYQFAWVRQPGRSFNAGLQINF